MRQQKQRELGLDGVIFGGGSGCIGRSGQIVIETRTLTLLVDGTSKPLLHATRTSPNWILRGGHGGELANGTVGPKIQIKPLLERYLT